MQEAYGSKGFSVLQRKLMFAVPHYFFPILQTGEGKKFKIFFLVIIWSK